MSTVAGGIEMGGSVLALLIIVGVIIVLIALFWSDILAGFSHGIGFLGIFGSV